MPWVVSSFRPMLSTVSIMPGMENFAPERQETSSGLCVSPNFRPLSASIFSRPVIAWSHMPSGKAPPWARYSLQASVLMVKPGGTGTPMRTISARFAPLPPSSPRTASHEAPI